MLRCSRCCIPDTRPDTAFVDGVCSACISYERRVEADWDARRRELELLLERGRNSSGFDCIVPSSGGKDSTWQVLQLLKLGAKPLVVTATTCHLTEIGRWNIDNLGRFAPTVEFTPNRWARRKLNRLAMEMVGDISWPEHVSIFTTPFRAAVSFGIPLIFYGENPQEAYGGPLGSEAARKMTRRWVSEFGGFLGLRPSDFEAMGLSLPEYRPPSVAELETVGVEAHFLGQYLFWDSQRNAEEAIAAGMMIESPSDANWWDFENLDNAQTGIHDHAMYRKYGYGRGCAQISVDVRAGRVKRKEALEWVRSNDGLYPFRYAGVDLDDVLADLGVDEDWLLECLGRFTNRDLFDGEDGTHRPILKA